MITVMTGKNEYALKNALTVSVQKALEEVGAFGIERIDATDTVVDDVLQAVQSVPFLVPKKFVVVQGVAHNKALLERIDEVIDRVAGDVDLVLVGPVFDKRSVAWKTLKKHAGVDVQEYNELKPFELPKWVVAHARQCDLRISLGDASYLIDRIGTNQLMLASELQKIGLQTPDITRDAIDTLTEPSPQSTVFEMLDAAFSGRQKRAIELYREQRDMRVDPHYIIAMLTWQLQSLATAVFAPEQSEQALVAAGQSPYAARKALGLSRKIGRSDVKRYIGDLVQLDADIKKSAEPDAALELYLLSM